MRFSFELDEASALSKQIFGTIYFGALEASCEIAEKEGAYSTYEGSTVSTGKLQYDMWGVKPSNLHDWAALKAKIDDKNEIISNNGSIQAVDCIPDNIKKLYKTVWEISQKNVLKQAAARGVFIDQSQSLNVHIAEPNWHVVPQDQACCPGYPIHSGQEQLQGCCCW